MKLRRLTGLISGIALCACVMTAGGLTPAVDAFTSRNLIVGSQGYDVYELQNRLHFLGFYNGQIDGRFGWKTYWAVFDFQRKFGMPETGEVTLPVKRHLVSATQGWRYRGYPQSQVWPTSHARLAQNTAATAAAPASATPAQRSRVNGVSANDQSLMARVIYGEARGEPFEGQVAIAAVILNRLNDPRFPHSIAGIIYQPGAFDAVWNGQANQTPNASAVSAVQKAIQGWDPSLGAVYYFNPATATSKWIWSRPVITKIGHHIFER